MDTIRRIWADVEAIERDESLHDETHFVQRAEAIDCLESAGELLEALLPAADEPEKLTVLRQSAQATRHRLEAVDANLFRQLRDQIRSGNCAGAKLIRCIHSYTANRTGAGASGIGYDCIDTFINGLLLSGEPPQEPEDRAPDMVAYQPAPARIVLELLDRIDIGESDVFCDLGSGLGRVVMLVNLATGVRARGLDVHSAYCDYARRCAAELNLSGCEFLAADARHADYSEGTVFFMYTPFRGELLRDVLEQLRQDTRQRDIKLFSYGPCTLTVSQQGWLEAMDQNADQVYRLAQFRRRTEHLTWEARYGSQRR